MAEADYIVARELLYARPEFAAWRVPKQRAQIAGASGPAADDAGSPVCRRSASPLGFIKGSAGSPPKTARTLWGSRSPSHSRAA